MRKKSTLRGMVNRTTPGVGLLTLALTGWLPAACSSTDDVTDTATSEDSLHGAQESPSEGSIRLSGQALAPSSELGRLPPESELSTTCLSRPPPPRVCYELLCNAADQAWEQVPAPVGTTCSTNGRCDEHQNCVPSLTHLSYFGGKVVQNANVFKVLYGSGSYIPEVTATTGTNMGTAYGQMMSSGVFDWLSEYNTTSPVQRIGRGSFGGSFSIAPAASHNGASVTDASIQAELAAQINLGVLPAPTDNAVYMVHFPAGKSITASDGSKSCVSGGFCAYHGTFKIGSQNVYYGVLPDLTGGCASGCGAAPTAFQNQQSVASHELVETITDAEAGLATTIGPPLAWYDANNRSEIGDLCVGMQGTFVGRDGATYTIQQEFSNQQEACITTRTPQTSDILFSNSNTGLISEFLMSNGTVASARNLLTEPSAIHVIGSGDFNGDGTSDILLGNSSTGQISEVLMSNGTVGTVVNLFAEPGEIHVVGVGDFNGDGTSDILFSNSNTGQISEWLMSNGAVVAAINLFAEPAEIHVVGIGDFNGDGTSDILFSNSNTGLLAEWLMSNGIVGSTINLFAEPAEIHVAGIGDFNGDGTSDILFTNSNTGLIAEWLMSNGTVATPINLFVEPAEIHVVGIGDFNGDRTSDILFSNSNTGLLAEWLMVNGTVGQAINLFAEPSEVHVVGTGSYDGH